MGRIRGVTPEETRSRLIDAAAEVFAERGYEGATIAGIARRAGLSTGAIYAHYRTKAELLVEVIRQRGETELREMLAADAPDDFGEVVVALGRRLDSQAPASRQLLVEAVIAARRDPELAEVLGERMAASQRRIARHLAAGQADGRFPDDLSPDVVARFVLMASLGARLFRTLGLAPLDEDDWERFVTRLVDACRGDAGTGDAAVAGPGELTAAAGSSGAAGRRGSRRRR